ncbi:acyl CoA binding protein-domain-containing protein [Spinellus fusiger]|nr:acyl CoA binding protein-domain-containing protein [Spinellus fusiger]
MASTQLDDWFESAYIYMSTHEGIKVSNDNKLKLYALFKQVIVGDCTTPKPGLFEFVNRAKWDAWQSAKGIPGEDAKTQYIALVESLGVGWSCQGEYAYQQSKEEEIHGLGACVSSLAQNEEEVYEEDLFGFTRTNNLDKVREQIKEFKQSVNSKDEEGLTPLHHACDRGYTDMARMLIDLGADINVQNNALETPLHYVTCLLSAYISEQFETARLLHQQGCDTSLRDEEGKTAYEQGDHVFVTELFAIIN